MNGQQIKFEQKEEKFECPQNELCFKMRKESLRKGIDALKENNSRDCIRQTLEMIHKMLITYECMPCEKLCKRITEVRNSIREENCITRTLYDNNRIALNMLIAELETFCKG